MITADESRRIAASNKYLAETELAEWPRGTWGSPVLVCDTARRPAYWLVPYRFEDRAVGFARILSDGRVLAIGILGRPGRALSRYPREVTGVSAKEAADIFSDCVRLESGEIAGEPRYVHDGPPGREAWLVETSRDGRPCRWVFVTASGCYERPPGTSLRDEPQA